MGNEIRLWAMALNYGQRDQRGGKFVVILVSYSIYCSRDIIELRHMDVSPSSATKCVCIGLTLGRYDATYHVWGQ